MKLSKTTQTQAVAKYYTELIIKRFGFLQNQFEMRGGDIFIDGIMVYKSEGYIRVLCYFDDKYINFSVTDFNNDLINYRASRGYYRYTDFEIKQSYEAIAALYGDAAKQLKAKYKIKSNSK